MDFHIGGFIPFTLTDYPGRVAAVVFTQGCNLACPFCHNKSLIPKKAVKQPVCNRHIREILDLLHKRKGRLKAVVISGGEPTLQPGLAGFIKEIRSRGYLVKLDTNGTKPEVIRDLIEKGLLDFVAMDVKAPLEKYNLLCGGKVDTQAILSSIRVIAESGISCQFRTTFVPHLLSKEDICAIRALLPKGAEHKIQRYVAPRMQDSLEHKSFNVVPA